MRWTLLPLSLMIACSSEPVDTFVANTFEDSKITGGAQAIFGVSDTVEISGEVEFPGFIGFYDVDLDDDGMVMTLIDNSGATDLVLPDGRFDRYYVSLSAGVEEASIRGDGELDTYATVSILDPGFALDVTDPFKTGLALPVTYANGGILLQIGPGADLTDLQQQVTVDFTLSN
ncbi:MAG: hypothetical protein AAGA48_24560 [Myxococcota bacterium]